MKLLLSILSVIGACFCMSCGASTSYSAASSPGAPYQVVVLKPFDYKTVVPVNTGSIVTKEFSSSVLAEELQKQRRFSKVTTGTYSGRALRIEGVVTHLDEGNTAVRMAAGILRKGKAQFNCTARLLDHKSGKLIGTLNVARISRDGVIGAGDDLPTLRGGAAADVAAKAAEFAAP